MLDGYRIEFEPQAVGIGEAPLTWKRAKMQRARWLNGTFRVSQHYAWKLQCNGLFKTNIAILDGTAQALFPSYSTLTLLCAFSLLVQWIVNRVYPGWISGFVTLIGTLLLGLLFVYPFLGLVLEKALGYVYRVILIGPIYILWRTGIAVWARFFKQDVARVRTTRQETKPSSQPGIYG